MVDDKSVKKLLPSRLLKTVPVQCADLHGCVCQSDGCCGLLKVGHLRCSWQLDTLPTVEEPVCGSLTLQISLIVNSEQKGRRIVKKCAGL